MRDVIDDKVNEILTEYGNEYAAAQSNMEASRAIRQAMNNLGKDLHIERINTILSELGMEAMIRDLAWEKCKSRLEMLQINLMMDELKKIYG